MIVGMDLSPPLGELREAELAELVWLMAQDDDGFLGYAPLGWPAETWVLHSMWEDSTPAAAPRTVEERWRDEHPGRAAVGILVYESAAFPGLPPVGWRRLRWRELSDRLGAPLTGGTWDGYRIPPSSRWFPIGSWPETIHTPSEGSLDAVAGDRLLELLAEHSSEGPETICFCFYDILASPHRLERLVLTGPLRAVFDAARYSSGPTPTPDNIWPADRSWLLWTNHDLWATRLIGPPALIASVDGDAELESEPFVYRPAPRSSREN
jgi:hypothetical protein